jgi:hypothetical protein
LLLGRAWTRQQRGIVAAVRDARWMSELDGRLLGMDSRRLLDPSVREILRTQCDLITRSQARTAGLSEAALRSRVRSAGPWKVVLPGIYLSHNGLLAAGQREMAAVLYAGPDSVITGAAAVTRHGLSWTNSDDVDVLVPHASKRQSHGFVRVHRTRRMPEAPVYIDGLRWAPAARAVADATRGHLELRDVRALVASAVQQRRCTVGQLLTELREGPTQGSGALRAALEEVADGVASAAEGDMRKLIKRGGLPEPLYNPRLYVGSDFLAEPDLYWREAGVAGEVDSREWHLSPELWARTLERHSRMSAQGIIVVHYTPRRIRTDGAQVVAELRSAIEAGRRRPALAVRVVPGR